MRKAVPAISGGGTRSFGTLGLTRIKGRRRRGRKRGHDPAHAGVTGLASPLPSARSAGAAAWVEKRVRLRRRLPVQFLPHQHTPPVRPCGRSGRRRHARRRRRPFARPSLKPGDERSASLQTRHGACHWRLFSVSARLVVRIPFEGADLIARRILTASLVDRRAAVDVIQLGIGQFNWPCRSFCTDIHCRFLQVTRIIRVRTTIR